MTALPGASSTANLPIYPYYCRALSLTLGRWCPLRAVDVHALQEVGGFAIGQDVFFWKNHMIKYVRLTGVIVAVEEFDGTSWNGNVRRMVYTLDDSSGVNIEVTCVAPARPTTGHGDAPGDSKDTSETTEADHIDNVKAKLGHITTESEKLISPDGPDLTSIDVGSVVKVKGGIGIFRERKHIRLKVITILDDTNAEVKCWNDATQFKGGILSKPWVVSKEEEEKCRLEEDREARWKLEEETKRKKDEMRRHLREKARELREKQREARGGVEETGKRNHDDKKRTRESREHSPDRHGEERRKNMRREGSENPRVRDIGESRKEPSRNSSKRDGGGTNPENRVSYLSKAARRRVAGKYDALGI